MQIFILKDGLLNAVDLDDESFPTIDGMEVDAYLGDLKDEVLYDSTLPSTSHNLRVVAEYMNGTIQSVEVPIICIIGGISTTFNYMIVSVNDYWAGSRISIVIGKKDFWIKKAKGKLLKDIDFGRIEHSFFETINDEGASYVDGGSWYRYPSCLTGLAPSYQSNENTDVHVTNRVPFIYLIYALKKGFLSIGWNFESPFLEGVHGRRILCYLSDSWKFKEFRPDKVLNNGVRITGYRDNLFLSRHGSSAILDGTYRDFVNCEVKFVAKVKALKASNFVIELKSNFEGNYGTYMLRHEQVLSKGEEIDIILDLKLPINGLRVGLTRLSNEIDLQFSELSFEILNITDRYLSEGDIYDYQETLSDDTLMDLFDGTAHLIGGKVEVNEESKTIRLLTPYEFEGLEGYYKNQTENLFKGKVLQNSYSIGSTEKSAIKNVKLGFKDPIEIAIDDKKKQEMFSTYVQFDTVGEETLGITNNYFGTVKFKDGINGIYDADFDYYSNETFGFLDLKTSDGGLKNVGRLVTYSIGKGEIIKHKRDERPIQNDYEGRKLFYSLQSYDDIVWSINASHQFMHLIFGNNRYNVDPSVAKLNHKTLYKIYEREIVNKINSVYCTFSCFLKYEDLLKIDLRKEYVVGYGSNPFLGYISSLSKNVFEEGQELSITLINRNSIFAVPSLLGYLSVRKPSNFNITITKNGCEYTIAET